MIFRSNSKFAVRLKEEITRMAGVINAQLRNEDDDETPEDMYYQALHDIKDGSMFFFLCFPGVGKTFLAAKNSMFVDQDCSSFRSGSFPKNYVDLVVRNCQDGRIYLMSADQSVRDYVSEQFIPWTLIYPKPELLEEYVERYKKDGASEKFIEHFRKGWNSWIRDAREQPGCFKYELGPGEYLSDIFDEIVVKVPEVETTTKGIVIPREPVHGVHWEDDLPYVANYSDDAGF